MPLATPGEGQILLDSMIFTLAKMKDGSPGQLQVQELGTFPRKVTIGDHSKDSQDFRSTWIISDLSGGHGIANHQTDATVNRYRYSSLDVSRPNMWTQLPVANLETGTAGTFWPVGDLLVSGTVEMYGVFGTDLHVWNEATDAWTDTTRNLTSAPVNVGVSFAGTGTLRLFIPRGATGYTTDTGAAISNVVSSGTVPGVRDFAILGTMLIALDTANQLWYSVDGTAWTSFGADGKIDGSVTAYRVDTYRDAMGNPSLIIATSGGVWVFDPAGPTLYEQDLSFPIHPDQGLAACVWRGDYYISVGMGVHKYNSGTGTIDAMGLDRDDGLVYYHSLDCKIIDLFPAYNELYALVSAGTGRYPTVHRWTGRGWHQVWDGVIASAAMTRLYVSQARSTYRVWWGGEGNSSYTVILDRAFANPKTVMIDTATNNLYTIGQLWTGMNDMGMAGYRKIAHSVKFRCAFVREDLNGTTVPVLTYRTKEEGAFTALFEAAGIVRTASTDPLDYLTINYWFNENRTGVVFDEIELKLLIDNQYFIGKYLTMDFMKIPRVNKSWNCVVDLSASSEINNPAALDAKLESLIDAETITTMVHRGVTYYVRLASWNGADNTGYGDTRGSRAIQIIEMRYEDNA
jgi:hypothetical protein